MLEPRKEIPGFCFESPWIRPLSFKIESVEVTARPRRLRATWTPELAQDLQTYHNIDAEEELIRLLSEEVTAEIDRNIVNTIAQDLMDVQPMGGPQGRLFYYDFTFDNLGDPKVYDDGSWSLGNTFEGVIGIKSEIKSHEFI